MTAPEKLAVPLTYGGWCRLLEGERLPAAVVDLDAFDRNAAHLAELIPPGQTLRVASKSVRVPALLRRVLGRGAPFKGLMTFSAEETAALHGDGFDDLLLAYPTLLPSDLAALREVHEAGGTVSAVCDSVETVRAFADAMAGVATPFRLVIEVDVSLRPIKGLHLGVRRSPLRTAAQVLALLAEVRGPLRVSGLMAYEAQVAGLGDRNPFKKLTNPVAALIRRRSVKAVSVQRERLATALTKAGHTLELFNGGGTGSLSFANKEPWLSELTTGSGLLCPHLFDYYSNLALEPACFFALQAVRTPAPGYTTCLGGGYVASGEPGWDKVPLPYLPRGLKLLPTEGCGEVQTPLRLSGATVPPGSPVLFRHAKAGELAERFNDYLLVSGGAIVDRVKTYRGAGRCFF